MPATCCEVTVTPVEKREPKIQWKGGEREREKHKLGVLFLPVSTPLMTIRTSKTSLKPLLKLEH